MRLKYLFIILLISLVCISSRVCGIECKNIHVIFDGQPFKSIKLYSFSAYDYFSIRDLASYYDASLEWYPVSGKVALIKNNKKLELFVKSTRVRFNSKKKRLNVPVEMQNDDVFVPAEIVLSDYFSDFTQSKSYWDRTVETLEISRRPNLFLNKCYRSENSMRLIFEVPERSDFRWAAKDTSFELYFSKAVVKDKKIDVSNGIAEEIRLFNANGQARATINVSTATDKMTFNAVSLPGFIQLTISSPYAPPPAQQTIPFGETVFSMDDNETLAHLGTLPAASSEPNEHKKVIILDAGHGGEDPGAIGPDGIKEKDITLAIVKKLKAMLDSDGSYQTILTRSDDTFVPLVERTNLANERKADLFISIHCNASLDKDSNGFEIYFLSENASDSEAQATAMFENSVVSFEKHASEKQAKLQELLWSMAVNEFINESSELSSLIAEKVSRTTRVENRGVKQAGFFVLRGAGMPAILVETAFISNGKEESKLKKDNFQRDIARMIYLGINSYVSRKDNTSGKENRS